MQEFHILEPNEEHTQNKPKIRTRCDPNLIPVAEMESDIILEHITDIELKIKEHKIRGPKPKPKPQPKPVKIQKPELEPTQIIFIKGPIILDFEEN